MTIDRAGFLKGLAVAALGQEPNIGDEVAQPARERHPRSRREDPEARRKAMTAL